MDEFFLFITVCHGIITDNKSSSTIKVLVIK